MSNLIYEFLNDPKVNQVGSESRAGHEKSLVEIPIQKEFQSIDLGTVMGKGKKAVVEEEKDILKMQKSVPRRGVAGVRIVVVEASSVLGKRKAEDGKEVQEDMEVDELPVPKKRGELSERQAVGIEAVTRDSSGVFVAGMAKKCVHSLARSNEVCSSSRNRFWKEILSKF
ncbi:unnamed protein product [Ilex paraguariensis]|uniref:Uncharacterized protein n=1 Tax=Ilex paraguariensis TaxID=185542 RepID=A0ABC8U664_9AQUA